MNCECKPTTNQTSDAYKKSVKIAEIIRKINSEYQMRLSIKQKTYPGLRCDGTIFNDLVKEFGLAKKLTKEELTEMIGQLLWSLVCAKDEGKFYQKEIYKNRDFINFLLYAIKHNIKIVWEDK